MHGHGQSTWNPEGCTGVQLADDMCALVEEVVGEPSGGIIAALTAARNPDPVRGSVFEDAPFFETLPKRVPTAYVGMDAFVSAQTFLQQSTEDDGACWYMPRSYWNHVFGPVWSISLAASSAIA